MPSGGEKQKWNVEDSGEDDAPEPAHEGARTDEYHEDEGESEIDGVENEPAVDEGKEESPALSYGRKTDTEAYKDDQEYVILPPIPALFLEERRHHFEYVAHPLVA